MATAQQPQQRREAIEFPPNVPVIVSLQYSAPRIVAGQFGNRAMFSTCDGRVLFLDPHIAEQITELQLGPRESFSITKCTSGRKDAPITWEVSRIVGEQPNGTFSVPKLPDAAPKPPARAETPVRGVSLVDEGKALVAAYAEVLNWALTTYEGRVKPDEVRSIMISAYIQRGKLGGHA